jgi:uncharacterized membrane protein YccC
MIEWLFGERLHDDEERSTLHQALRVALVMPALYAFGILVAQSPAFSLLAGFGAFAALAMADFTGPWYSRLPALGVLAVAGAAFIALGTWLSATLWPAFAAMLVIGFLLQFSIALGGQFALGNNAAMLSFVLCAMVPAGPEAIPARIAGWLTAIGVSALAATFMWPRNERRDLYNRVAEALRPLAAAVRAVADSGPSGQALHEANAAIGRVREEERALGFRPIGPPEHQQALLGLIDALAEAWRFTCSMVAVDTLHPADCRLAHAVAQTMDDMAEVMVACARGRRARARVTIDVDTLAQARRRHRDHMRGAAAAALIERESPTSVVARLASAFPIRILSFVTLSMAVDAAVTAGRTARVGRDVVVLESPKARERWRHFLAVLAPLLVPETAWFHASLRAALGLAAAMAVAKSVGIAHGFWVVLATLGVLRSNVVTTGSTILNALAGTAVGFALGALAIHFLAPHPLLMWLSLPLVVFAAAYAQHAISFGIGQALFALLVVEMFNLVETEGLMTGVIRLEAVALGALVALVVSLVMWPKGAAAALREAIAEHVRAAQHLVDATFEVLLGRAPLAHAETARDEALDVRRRADEALAAFTGEPGAKRVPPQTWSVLARTPVLMRLAADAVIALERGDYRATAAQRAAASLDDVLAQVRASFLDLADRLDDPARPANADAQVAVADLDATGGVGARTEALLRETVEFVDAHRDDPASTVHEAIAFVWGIGWLAYLAHVRMQSEGAAEEVLRHATARWWK